MSISPTWNFNRKLIADIHDRLNLDPWFLENRVTILEQDEGNILQKLNEATERMDGPVLIITIARMRANAPELIVDVDLVITEIPTINRSLDPYASALDVALRSAHVLSSDSSILLNSISSDMTEDGIFQSVASFQY